MGMTFDEAKRSDDLAETLATLEGVGSKLHNALHEQEEAEQILSEARSREVACNNAVRDLQKQFDALADKVRELGGKHTKWEA